MKDASTDDAHAWLEDVEGERALAQVGAWNARTLGLLEKDPRYAGLHAAALDIVNATDRIPYGAYRGGWVYNFWQDETQVRGLVRRTSLEAYLSAAPDWETLLDVDALAESDDKNWVYKGSSCLPPDYTRCILTLSDGGKDAAVRREWDHDARAFVEGGFSLPESKGGTAWRDIDTLYVATDWGEGTMTQAGYPLSIRALSRGQAMEDAREIIRGQASDVGVWPFRIDTPDGPVMLASQAVTFFETVWWWLPDDGEPVALPLPLKSSVQGHFDGQLLVTLEEEWTPAGGAEAFPQGALVSFSLSAFMETRALPGVHVVYGPGARESIGGVSSAANRLLLTVTENVRGAVYGLTFADGVWTRERLDLPDDGALAIASANLETDIVFANATGFLRPDSYIALDVASGGRLGEKAAPARFDAGDLVVEQFETASADGVLIPYFVVRRKHIAHDGSNPTLLYGYGGFEVPMNPSYSGLRGRLWLERGGVFVLANIRGGGEFGPAWHQASLKTRRQTGFNDMIAIAEDLVARAITTPRRLGVMGGSNGGLLVGAMYVQRPDLWNAVVCQVPLLDMLRYHQLLAGASWVGEYGDPDDTEEGAFLASISPYHNVDADTDYPEIFFVTSTKDDRVHPGHARKMAALLEELGHPFQYYENIDGGHSAAANLRETAHRAALEYTWLTRRLMD